LGGTSARKKTTPAHLLQYEFIRQLILLREVTFATSCDKVVIDVESTFGHWNDVIDSVCIHAAPIAFTPISIEYPQPDLLPLCAVALTL
jgi:hypothetical protein